MGEILEKAGAGTKGRDFLLRACFPTGTLSPKASPFYGATYDSSEHFWQAVKYHPDPHPH